MRGYVEALEAWESELPEDVEPDYDQFYKMFRGEQPLACLCMSLANKPRERVSLANKIETDKSDICAACEQGHKRKCNATRRVASKMSDPPAIVEV